MKQEGKKTVSVYSLSLSLSLSFSPSLCRQSDRGSGKLFGCRINRPCRRAFQTRETIEILSPAAPLSPPLFLLLLPPLDPYIHLYNYTCLYVQFSSLPPCKVYTQKLSNVKQLNIKVGLTKSSHQSYVPYRPPDRDPPNRSIGS